MERYAQFANLLNRVFVLFSLPGLFTRLVGRDAFPWLQPLVHHRSYVLRNVATNDPSQWPAHKQNLRITCHANSLSLIAEFRSPLPIDSRAQPLCRVHRKVSDPIADGSAVSCSIADDHAVDYFDAKYLPGFLQRFRYAVVLA